MSPVSTKPSSAAQRRRIGAQIARRRALRADAQRAVLDLHLDRRCARPPDELGRKPGEAVVDVERHAGLGGGEGMGDLRRGIGGAQADRASPDRRFRPTGARSAGRSTPLAAHERAAPVRGRSGDVRDAGGGGARSENPPTARPAADSTRERAGRARRAGRSAGRRSAGCRRRCSTRAVRPAGRAASGRRSSVPPGSRACAAPASARRWCLR